MAEPQLKRSKLDKLVSLRHKLPYVSQTALAAVIRELRDAPIDENVSRKDIRRARKALCETVTPYGMIMIDIHLKQKSGDDTVKIAIQNPWAMLWFAANRSEQWAKLIRRSLAASPSSPSTKWRLMLYTDEISPGNQLKSHNRKKQWAVYYSFLEFGPAALACEEFWLVATVVRSDVVRDIQGGASALIGGVLKVFFDRSGHHLERAGISLDMHCSGEKVRIFSKFGIFLADEDALHQVWKCKGSSGIKSCLQCMNIVASWWHTSKALQR